MGRRAEIAPGTGELRQQLVAGGRGVGVLLGALLGALLEEG